MSNYRIPKVIITLGMKIISKYNKQVKTNDCEHTDSNLSPTGYGMILKGNHGIPLKLENNFLCLRKLYKFDIISFFHVSPFDYPY